MQIEFKVVFWEGCRVESFRNCKSTDRDGSLDASNFDWRCLELNSHYQNASFSIFKQLLFCLKPSYLFSKFKIEDLVEGRPKMENWKERVAINTARNQILIFSFALKFWRFAERIRISKFGLRVPRTNGLGGSFSDIDRH